MNELEFIGYKQKVTLFLLIPGLLTFTLLFSCLPMDEFSGKSLSFSSHFLVLTDASLSLKSLDLHRIKTSVSLGNKNISPSPAGAWLWLACAQRLSLPPHQLPALLFFCCSSALTLLSDSSRVGGLGGLHLQLSFEKHPWAAEASSPVGVEIWVCLEIWGFISFPFAREPTPEWNGIMKV